MNLLKALFLFLFLLGGAPSSARVQDVERECAAGALAVQGTAKVTEAVNAVVESDPTYILRDVRGAMRMGGAAVGAVAEFTGELVNTAGRVMAREALGYSAEEAHDLGLKAKDVTTVGVELMAPGAAAKGFSKLARVAEVAGEASAVARGARVAAADVAAVEALVADHAATEYAAQLGLQVPGHQPVKLGVGRVEQAVGASKSVWSKGPVVRGVEIEQRLGQNLHPSFPTIDKFENGIATSIKSLDLNAPTYQNPTTLRRVLRQYVDKVAAFEGEIFAERVIEPQHILSRQLELAIPSPGNALQGPVLREMIEYAAAHPTNSVKLNISIIS